MGCSFDRKVFSVICGSFLAKIAFFRNSFSFLPKIDLARVGPCPFALAIHAGDLFMEGPEARTGLVIIPCAFLPRV
jgi:hypothetical protein